MFISNTFKSGLSSAYCILLMLCTVSYSVSAATQSQDNTAIEETSSEVNNSGSTGAGFGGPNSPEGQLQESEREKAAMFNWNNIFGKYEPWHEWKKEVKDDHGFHFSGHHASMYQGLSDAPQGGDDSGASGVLRMNGKWDLLNRGKKNTGSLVLTVDHRHAYTDTAPADLAIGSAGYVGLTATFFNDIGVGVVYLNWSQSLNDGDSGFIVGRYDPNDYMNILGYANPWVTFTNLSIFLNASVAFPDSSWGVGGGHWLNDQWYVVGGINDANGLVSDNLEFFDGGSEFYKYAHVGWSPSKSERYSTNVHFLVWDVDERVDVDIDAANGYAIAANWTSAGGFMPFVHYGNSNSESTFNNPSPIYQESVTLGFTQQLPFRSDQAGIAVNWGELSGGDSEQTTVEAFWNIQVAAGFAVTPDIQYLRLCHR